MDKASEIKPKCELFFHNLGYYEQVHVQTPKILVRKFKPSFDHETVFDPLNFVLVIWDSAMHAEF